MRYRLLVSSLLILALIHGTPSLRSHGWAAEPESEPNRSPPVSATSLPLQRKFRQHVEAGQALFATSKWTEAVTEYLAAYQIYPQSLLLFNVAQSYRKAQQPAFALRYYEEFIHKEPQSPLTPECEAHAQAMRTQIEAERIEAERQHTEMLAKQREQEALRLTVEKQSLEQKVAEERRTVESIKRQPIYKKKWFWVVLGGAVVAASAVGIIVWKTRPDDVSLDGGAYDFDFPKQ